MSPEARQAAIDLVLLEGALLDERDWDTWLDLYWEDAEYWIPSWDDEDTLVDDPHNAISLIYYANRSGLEDRVHRLRTERSLASTPLPRTCHITSNFRLSATDDDELVVASSWVTHAYRLQTTTMYFGRQTHRLRRTDNDYRICARKIIVCNDRIANVLDIYSV